MGWLWWIQLCGFGWFGCDFIICLCLWVVACLLDWLGALEVTLLLCDYLVGWRYAVSLTVFLVYCILWYLCFCGFVGMF